jgi:hypothetical protein
MFRLTLTRSVRDFDFFESDDVVIIKWIEMKYLHKKNNTVIFYNFLLLRLTFLYKKIDEEIFY